jgi:hypothetical protein
MVAGFHRSASTVGAVSRHRRVYAEMPLPCRLSAWSYVALSVIIGFVEAMAVRRSLPAIRPPAAFAAGAGPAPVSTATGPDRIDRSQLWKVRADDILGEDLGTSEDGIAHHSPLFPGSC